MRKHRAAIAAATAFLLACLLPSSVLGHAGDPNFRSEVRDVSPAVEGLTADVLNYDDRLLLRNDSGSDVTVMGYEDEPYVRLRGDGTVEVNRHSPAAYLNEDRFARLEVPAEADPSAAPAWQEVGRDGRFEWHDHRIHWMVEDRRPPQVADPDVETGVFDWRVPIEVAGERGAIRGELRWVPLPGGGFPLWAALSLAAAAAGGAAAVILVRRRRRRRAPDPAVKEAW